MADEIAAEQARCRAREAIYDLLMERIRRDTYPSATMMDIVECQLPDEKLAEYLDVLIHKIDGDRFPSMDMIRRIVKLT